jgi:ATP-dependent DNA helicase RecG
LFGEDFNRLAPLEVQTLVTADLEGEVSNGRLQLIRSEHPVELTKMLQGLATKGFLDQVGQKRWCRYRLPDWAAPVARGASPLALEAPPLARGAPPLALEAPPLAAGAPPLVPGVAPEADPVLLEVAKPAREKKKLTPALTKRLLRRLCEGRFLTAEQMALLLERTKDKLRDNFLAAMVNEGELQLRYPDQPTHPEQAYRSNPDWRER